MNTSQAKKLVKKSVSKAVASCGSQSALARKAKITQGAIGKYLRGDALPTGVTAKKLSEAVNSEIDPYYFAPLIFERPIKDRVA